MSDFWENLQARRELKKQIDEISNEITMLERIKTAIERIRLQIEEGIEDWEAEYAQYINLDLTEDIQVINSFEGKAAEDLAFNFPPIVKEINEADGKVSTVASAIGDQLIKIDEYMEILKTKRDELYTQLEAL